MERFAERTRSRVSFSREARRRFLEFAESAEGAWSGNFRDLAAAVTRMATLAPGGRITESVVGAEVQHLRTAWRALERGGGESARSDAVVDVLGPDAAAALDRFDRVRLADVLEVCAVSPTLSAAGRTLFAQSRLRRSSRNDADRIRKYLATCGLAWEDVGPERVLSNAGAQGKGSR